MEPFRPGEKAWLGLAEVSTTQGTTHSLSDHSLCPHRLSGQAVLLPTGPGGGQCAGPQHRDTAGGDLSGAGR